MSNKEQDLGVIRRPPCSGTGRIKTRPDRKTIMHISYCLAGGAFTLRQYCSNERLDKYQLCIDDYRNAHKLPTNGTIQLFYKCSELGHIVQCLGSLIRCRILPPPCMLQQDFSRTARASTDAMHELKWNTPTKEGTM